MEIYGQIKQVRDAVKAWKREGKSVGFVPTRTQEPYRCGKTRK